MRNRDNRIARYKLRRMRQALGTMPEYGEVFKFYEEVIRLREAYAARLHTVIDPFTEDGDKARRRYAQGLPLIDRSEIRLDRECMKEHFMALFDLISANTPLDLSPIGAILKGADPGRPVCDLIEEIRGRETEDRSLSGMVQFMISETVNPILEIRAGKFREEMAFDRWRKGMCPVCGGLPLLGVISHENGRRELVCADCCTPWIYPRLKCPFCGNEDQKTLSYLRIEPEEGCRIEVCHACRHYLKTLTPSAPPPLPAYDIENLATLHLDLIAGREGYRRAAGDRYTEQAAIH